MKLWFFIIHFQECIPTRQMTVSDKINSKKTVSLTTQKKLPPLPVNHWTPTCWEWGQRQSSIHIMDSGRWGHTWSWLSTPNPFWMFQRPPELSPEETDGWPRALHSQTWMQALKSPLAIWKRSQALHSTFRRKEGGPQNYQAQDQLGHTY